MIYWFFGYPGVGKDYLAKLFSEISKTAYINVDDFLTAADRKKLKEGVFTAKDRDKKLRRAIKSLKKDADYSIADSLPNEASRKLLRDAFRNKIKFILVEVPRPLHIKRLKSRKGHFFTFEMLDSYIQKNWEKIQSIEYSTIKNNLGKKSLEKKLKLLR